MARNYAGILGLLAFATVNIRGLVHSAGAETTLWTATLSLVAFALVGVVAGKIASMTVMESVRLRINAQLDAEQEMRGRQTSL